MIIADTSVWIYHLRKGSLLLEKLLYHESILIHPFIIGELACGNMKNRHEILHLLSKLPVCKTALNHEILDFIEHKRLMGQGIGYVDIHLLASASLTDSARLWTLDKILHNTAEKMNLHFPVL